MHHPNVEARYACDRTLRDRVIGDDLMWFMSTIKWKWNKTDLGIKTHCVLVDICRDLRNTLRTEFILPTFF